MFLQLLPASESPRVLVKRHILILHILGEVQDSVLLTSSQVMIKLLSLERTLSSEIREAEVGEDEDIGAMDLRKNPGSTPGEFQSLDKCLSV